MRDRSSFHIALFHKKREVKIALCFGKTEKMMIDISSVTKKYGKKTAVDNLSIHIEKNSFVGLLGPNGAGKTTLMKMISALLKPTQGSIHIDGSPVSRDNNPVKAMLGVVPQYSNLEKEMTVNEDLVFAAKLFRIPKVIYRERIDDLLEALELKEAKHQLSSTLSGGMQRKVMIAKALIHKPKIMLLDEPTVGIDMATRVRIWDILKDMQSAGMTLLMTTHYIEEAETLCDRVCFIDEGKLFLDGHPKSLIEDFGHFTVEEYFPKQGSMFSYFFSREEAVQYSRASTAESVLLRELTLGDIFYHYTKRKVN